jgi:hypothetical protein
MEPAGAMRVMYLSPECGLRAAIRINPAVGTFLRSEKETILIQALLRESILTDGILGRVTETRI